MPLRITRSFEPIQVTRTIACIYAPPGLGKTSLACTSEKPLLLDFDGGAHRTKYRGDVVRVETWDDVNTVSADDLKPYRTVVVDTAGRALDVLARKLIADNPKLGQGGALSLKGFGALKADFIAWARMLNSHGLDVIMVAHSDEQRSGDDLIERLDMQGGSKNEIYKMADSMGRIFMRNKKRVLTFSPTDTAFGKNPGQLPELEIPDFATDRWWFSGVLSKIKAKLNELSEEQTAAAKCQAEWTEKATATDTVEKMNALLPELASVDEALLKTVKLIVHHVATGKGYTFDKEKGLYVVPEAKKQEAGNAPK
jgi:hypothetical protein